MKVAQEIQLLRKFRINDLWHSVLGDFEHVGIDESFHPKGFLKLGIAETQVEVLEAGGKKLVSVTEAYFKAENLIKNLAASEKVDSPANAEAADEGGASGGGTSGGGVGRHCIELLETFARQGACIAVRRDAGTCSVEQVPENKIPHDIRDRLEKIRRKTRSIAH